MRTKNGLMKVCYAGFFLGSFALLTSCAKQYTCRCETNDGFVTTSEISEGSEEKSAASCEQMEYTSSYVVDSVTYTTVNTCELQ